LDEAVDEQAVFDARMDAQPCTGVEMALVFNFLGLDVSVGVGDVSHHVVNDGIWNALGEKICLEELPERMISQRALL